MNVAKPNRLPALTRLFTKWKMAMWKETIANVLGKNFQAAAEVVLTALMNYLPKRVSNVLIKARAANGIVKNAATIFPDQVFTAHNISPAALRRECRPDVIATTQMAKVITFR